jgi:hypothetical protein
MLRTILFALLILAGQLNAQPAMLRVDAEPMHALPVIHSVFNNPLAVTGMKNAMITVGQSRGFMLRELDKRFVAAVVPVKSAGVLTASLIASGNNYFMQQYFTAGYARNFGGNISAAMTGWLYNVAQSEGYGSRRIGGCTAGFSGAVGRSVVVSSLLELPLQRDEWLFPSAVFKAGASIRCSEICRIETSGQLRPGAPFVLAAGIHYLPSEKINLRFGIQSQPFSFYAGFAYRFFRWEFDVAASHQPVTGLTPRVGIAFFTVRKEDK